MKVSDILRVKGNTLFTVTPEEPLADALRTKVRRDMPAATTLRSLSVVLSLSICRFLGCWGVTRMLNRRMNVPCAVLWDAAGTPGEGAGGRVANVCSNMQASALHQRILHR